MPIVEIPATGGSTPKRPSYSLTGYAPLRLVRSTGRRCWPAGLTRCPHAARSTSIWASHRTTAASTRSWPLVRGDADDIGIASSTASTTASIRGHLAPGFPEIAADDNEADVWIKSIALAARLVPEALPRRWRARVKSSRATRSPVRARVSPVSRSYRRWPTRSTGLRRAFGHRPARTAAGRTIRAPPAA